MTTASEEVDQTYVRTKTGWEFEILRDGKVVGSIEVHRGTGRYMQVIQDDQITNKSVWAYDVTITYSNGKTQETVIRRSELLRYRKYALPAVSKTV
jgi:hypothetical protein